MIRKGYEIILTEVAADGLGKNWLGQRLNEKNLDELFKKSR